MQRYLISFPDGAMDHVSEDDLPDVSRATRAVVHQAKDAGVWVFGAGLPRQRATVVATDGTSTDGPPPETATALGGFSIIEVSSRAEALDWAARIAAGCRCAQEVREIFYDPES
ncbi:hypothetical protein GB931_17465 [Modestobacter sp. I12A-02628]|uniref:YCII-related domain-containing protein n=1 Tax=Goekera deserti TaxID=2497753 RepID=A0A7K3WGW6_9ACTN|nr:YciI family protein [Goekera deserti]MPQ99675.1 hypothetical protein [Goekera deserti]NDI46315.1 hypothetical protein [Goekera deserti]NEL54753.1 hypothetical protein [Goekera deserti]